MKSRASTGVKECLNGEDVAIGFARGSGGATSDFEGQSRKGPHETDRSTAAQPILERSAPRESVGEYPVAIGAAVGQRSRIVVAGARRHPKHVAALSRKLKNLSRRHAGQRGHGNGERKNANEVFAHWS